MVMGGLINMVLYMLVIVNEVGIDYDLECINVIVKCMLYLLKIVFSLLYLMYDVYEVGGVLVIINELMKKDGMLYLDRIIVIGKMLCENNEGKEIKNFDVIYFFDVLYDV